MRVAIFDLGSTSFHAVVVEVGRDGTFERVSRSRETLHLAGAAASTGHLPPDAVLKALRSAKALRKQVERSAPDIAVASATSALRDASNGEHLIERLERVLKLPIRILDGNEEARLAFRGATWGLRVPSSERVLVADLGGGSLEVAIGRPDDIELTATFPLGASRLTALHVASDPPSSDELACVERAVLDDCASLIDRLTEQLPMRAIVAGGTSRGVGRISAGREDVDGIVIPTARLHSITRKLAKATRDERAAMPFVQAKRVDVLPAGALVLATVLDALDLGAMTVSESGLREGLLLEILDEIEHPAVGIAR